MLCEADIRGGIDHCLLTVESEMETTMVEGYDSQQYTVDGELSMFQIENFIDECQAAVKESDALSAVNELVARIVSEPAQVLYALGEPERSAVQTIYKACDLTILNVCWGPRMEVEPHDHRMWAVIGIYGGREQNTFYRRSKAGLTKHGIKELNAKDA